MIKRNSALITGLLLGVICGAVLMLHAQHVFRTTSASGGPTGQNYLADYDTAMITLPSSATTVISTNVLVNSIYCHNITGSSHTVTITDNSNVVYVPTVTLAGNTVSLFMNAGTKGVVMAGIKWNADATSAVNCEISGWN